ncbi:MAG: PDZ domain-containing protein [Planctomycetes bacterium]|nr:PDZ domain-containing protein [Planctomycetota bacterium]
MTSPHRSKSMALRTGSAPLWVLAACALGALAPSAPAQDAPPARAAAEESVREKVERLLPDFMSESESTRARAEKEIVALGEPARAELDRLTRDTDPQKAIAALKLLQSPAWERRARQAEDARRDAPGRGPAIGPRLPDIDLRRLQDELDRQMQDMRRSVEEWRKQFDADDWMPGFEAHGGSPSKQDESRGASSGQVIENGRSLSWTIDDAGKVKVTVRDGNDAAEQVYEAASLAELRKQHPDVAKRLDGFLPSGGLRRWTLVWPPRASWDETDRTGAAQRDPELRDGEQKLAPAEQSDTPLLAVPGPVLGITWGDVPDVLRDQLDLPVGGLVVTGVAADSVAARLGVRRNDVLVSLGGRPIASPADIRKTLESARAPGEVSKPLAAEVLRKGKRETLTEARTETR